MQGAALPFSLWLSLSVGKSLRSWRIGYNEPLLLSKSEACDGCYTETSFTMFSTPMSDAPSDHWVFIDKRECSSMAIRLMAHNEQWQQEFIQSRSMLLHATEGWLSDVRHVGSTALPNMVAQPVIDMIAAIQDLRGLNEAANLIEGLNYARVATPEWCQDELVAKLQKPRSGAATHMVLVVRDGSPTWQRVLALQTLLEGNLLERQNFENLKRDHFQPGCAAEQQYELAKASFFEELETRYGET